MSESSIDTDYKDIIIKILSASEFEFTIELKTKHEMRSVFNNALFHLLLQRKSVANAFLSEKDEIKKGELISLFKLINKNICSFIGL